MNDMDFMRLWGNRGLCHVPYHLLPPRNEAAIAHWKASGKVQVAQELADMRASEGREWERGRYMCDACLGTRYEDDMPCTPCMVCGGTGYYK